MTKKIIAVWDLGATKCAVGLVEYDTQTEKFKNLRDTTLYLNEFFSLEDLTEGLEKNLEISFSEVDKILIAGAGIYDGQTLNLTNGFPYPMTFARLAESRRWPAMEVVHDYVPIICGTFIADLQDDAQVHFIHRGDLEPYGRRVVFGIGTGLGFKDGVLLQKKRFWLGANEVGHIGVPFPPRASMEEKQIHEEFMYFLRTQTDLARHDMPVTFEKILSGKGLSRLHQFVTAAKQHLLPHEVGDLLRSGEAQETLSLFAWYIGLLVGTLELIFMPAGGTWMTGGVLLKHANVVRHPSLRKGVLASPAYTEERKSFPLVLMHDKNLLFLGGAYYITYSV